MAFSPGLREAAAGEVPSGALWAAGRTDVPHRAPRARQRGMGLCVCVCVFVCVCWGGGGERSSEDTPGLR